MGKRYYRGVIAILLALLMVAMAGLPAYAESEGPWQGDDPETILSGEGAGDMDGDEDIGTGDPDGIINTDGEAVDPDEDVGLGNNKDETEGFIKIEGAGEDPRTGEEEPSGDGLSNATASDLLQEKASSGIKLTAAMKQEKAGMARLGLWKKVSGMKADRDFVNHEIIYPTENKAEAKLIAEAYDGVVTSVSDGVAVIKLAANTLDAIEKAENPGNDFPAIYPNFMYRISSETYSGEEMEAMKAALGEEEAEADGSGAVEGDATGGAATDEEGGIAGEGNGSEGRQVEVIVTEDPEDIDTVFEQKQVTQRDIDAVSALQAPVILTDADSAGSGKAGAFAEAPNDTHAGHLWHHVKVGTYKAWDYTKGNGIKVAVIDSGITAAHPDLKNNLVGAFTTARHAYNKHSDNFGHGTHVAGIIAAQANNKLGVAGVAPQAKIISIKALDYYWDEDGYLSCGGNTADIMRGINMAVSKGARVINMSLGAYCDPAEDVLYAKSVANAINKGIVVVAAAGNDTKNLGTNPVTPALFDDVICVSATTDSDTIAGYSNRGSGFVTIAAPGGSGSSTPAGREIASTYKANSYAWMSGTSMAAPVVSGVVALLFAQNATYRENKNIETVRQITKVITSTATKAPNYSNTANFGAGLINAEAATNLLAGGVPVPDLTPQPTSDVTVSGFNITTKSASADVTIKIEAAGAPTGATYYYTLDGKNPTLKSLSGGTFTVSANGKKEIQVRAVTCVGGKFSAVKTVKFKFDVKIASVSLTPKSGAYDPSDPTAAAVGLGKPLGLAATFSPTKPTNNKLIWDSGDASVAKVSSAGVVTGKGLGTATITATARDGSGKVGTIKVKVYPLTKSVSLSAAKVKLATEACTLNGEPLVKTVTLVATPSPAEALGGVKNFTYKSNKPKIASVNENGVVTALASGSAVITVTARDGSGKKATCAVTVIKPAKIVSVTNKEGQPVQAPLKYVVGKGKTINLTAVLEDKKATNAKVVWASNDTGIATVTSGKIKGISVGNVTVSVRTADGVDTVKNITIEVKEATGSLGSNAAKTTLKLYQNPASTTSETFSWTIDNKTAGAHTDQYVYTVKNKKVAAVVGSGSTVSITVNGKGSTVITAKAVDGSGKTTSINVTVQKMVTRIYLAPPVTDGIAYGKSMKFGATVYPSDASNKKLKWEVDETDYFKVDASGKVTLKKKSSPIPTWLWVTPADNPAATRIYVSPKKDPTGTMGYGVNTYEDRHLIYGYNHAVTKMAILDKWDRVRTSLTMEEWDIIDGFWVGYIATGKDCYAAVAVTSSNDRVAEFYYDDLYEEWCMIAYSPGTTTITVKSADGSNKSAKLKVTVKAAKDNL